MAHKIHEHEFKKKGGETRRMRFYRLGGMTLQERAELGIPAPSERPHAPIPDGSELVWDLDARGFRVFNWKTIIS
jgi:hypothetical protein